jgi:Spy/CpxP family protein refolding chaperone
MRTMITVVALTVALVSNSPVHGAETDRFEWNIPDDFVSAWERLQRAFHDWSGQLRGRLGARETREERPLISQILNDREELRLSGEQVRKLEQLRDEFQRQSIRTEADLKIIELDVAALLDGDSVDLTKVEQKVRESEKLRADLRIARVRALEQAKAVLTAEQRRKFFDATESRMARRSQIGAAPPAAER